MCTEVFALLGFHFSSLLKYLFLIKPCEKDLRLVGNLGLSDKSELLKLIQIPDLCTQLSADLLCGIRQVRSQQGSSYRYTFGQVVEYGAQPVGLCLILSQYPGLGLIYIFIESLIDIEYLCQRIGNMQRLHALVYLGCCGGYYRFKVVIH